MKIAASIKIKKQLEEWKVQNTEIFIIVKLVEKNV